MANKTFLEKFADAAETGGREYGKSLANAIRWYDKQPTCDKIIYGVVLGVFLLRRR